MHGETLKRKTWSFWSRKPDASFAASESLRGCL